MLKKYKNDILETIKEVGLNPEHFSATEIDSRFIIKLLDTPLQFTFVKQDRSYHLFEYSFVTFSPKHDKYISGNPEDFLTCISDFQRWLENHVAEYLNELTTPDLWKQLEDQKALLDYTHQDNDKATHFTDEQKRLIRLGLDEVLLLIKNEFQPTADEIGVINNRLDYISEALDRLNKFDWKAVLVSTIISISIALSLDTAQGNALFHMFKQVLSKAFTLLLK